MIRSWWLNLEGQQGVNVSETPKERLERIEQASKDLYADAAFNVMARTEMPWLVAEVKRLRAVLPRGPEDRLPLAIARAKEGSFFERIAHERLADEVAVLVMDGTIDARSPAGDALLDCREPPSSPRADRLKELTERAEKAERELGAARALSERRKKALSHVASQVRFEANTTYVRTKLAAMTWGALCEMLAAHDATEEGTTPPEIRCCDCGGPLGGRFVGAGDGSGQRYRCTPCDDHQRAVDREANLDATDVLYRDDAEEEQRSSAGGELSASVPTDLPRGGPTAAPAPTGTAVDLNDAEENSDG